MFINSLKSSECIWLCTFWVVFEVMACCLFGIKLLPKAMMTCAHQISNVIILTIFFCIYTTGNCQKTTFIAASDENFITRMIFTHTDTVSQIARFMGPTWGPSGSCRTQMGPMLAPWTLLSGVYFIMFSSWDLCKSHDYNFGQILGKLIPNSQPYTAMQGFETVGLIFFNVASTVGIFSVCECASVFLIFVRKYSLIH